MGWFCSCCVSSCGELWYCWHFCNVPLDLFRNRCQKRLNSDPTALILQRPAKTKMCVLEFLGKLLPFPAFLCTKVQIAPVVGEEEDNLWLETDPIPLCKWKMVVLCKLKVPLGESLFKSSLPTSILSVLYICVWKSPKARIFLWRAVLGTVKVEKFFSAYLIIAVFLIEC